MTIPKMIHYCWFSDKPKPDNIKRCIDSWYKVLDDYIIIEWNENNYDVNKNPFVKKAYETKKYAFCADVCKLEALYNYGGISLDADCLAIKPLNRFLQHRAFTGHEADKYLVSATMGAHKGHSWVKLLLDYYNNIEFNENNMIPNTQIITKLSEPLIIKKENGFTYLHDDVVIYPTEYFASYDHVNYKPIVNENSHMVHLFEGSWLNDIEQGLRHRK